MKNISRSIVLMVLLSGNAAFGQTTQPTHTRGLSADQMLNQMLKPGASGSRTLAPAVEASNVDNSSKMSVAPSAPMQGLIREGTFLVDRTGRLTHSADGQQVEFTFDSDGKAMHDPPVVILPNLKLVQIENAATSGSRELRFRITGMVTEYRGRNYVLLEKVVVVPDTIGSSQ